MIAKTLPAFLSLVVVVIFTNCEDVQPNGGSNSLQSNIISEQDFNQEEVAWSEDHGLGWPGNNAGVKSRGVFRSEGCRNSSMCCQGRDNECFARGRKINEEFGEKCFCDSNCLIVKDCCWDYKDSCPAVDCQLDTWSEWSDCDAKCGFGVRQRSRNVAKEAQNGGKPCEATNQKQVCEGTHCKLTRDSDYGNELRETGRILSLEFSRWRNDVSYDPYKDIRRNIFLNYNQTPLETITCATYAIKHVHQSCKTDTVADHIRALKKGNQVCVECHPMASLDHLGGRCFGQGILRKETRWSVFGKAGCRGTWVMESKREDCTCSSKHPTFSSYSFI